MDSIEIRAALARLGWTQADIATETGIAASTISSVINRKARSAKAEAAIAALLSRPLHVVWPGWYGADGHRIRTGHKRIDPAALQRLREALARAA